MRLRRVRLGDGRESVVLWHDERWVPLAPALEGRDASPRLREGARDLVALLAGGPALEEEARALAEGARPLGQAEPLLPFAPRSFRDFALWERHMIDAARGVARRFLSPRQRRAMLAYERASRRTFPRLRPGPLWYERPIYYRGNHLAFLPDGATVPWPSYTQALDYELELGLVLAAPLFDATPEEAMAAVGGYVLVCDWSARDVQLPEMARSPFGPAKSKDFANSLGPVVVTPDELPGGVEGLEGEVRVNGETWSRGSAAGMTHSVADMVAYASLGEPLQPGELLATGTIPGCSGVEVDRWLSPGDTVELDLGSVGRLRATIGTPQPGPARGPLRRARWTVVPRGEVGPEVPAPRPAAWQPPRARTLTGSLAPNERLDRLERWELPGGQGPEDVVLDAQGRVYTGVEDGRIYRFAPDGSSAELVADTHGRPLGLELDPQGRLLVCDADRGLLRLSPDGELEVLVDTFEGRRLRFTNNAAVDAQGVVYFTDTSTRFDVANYTLDLLEHRPHGRLLAHDPVTGRTWLVLDGLHFANGVALAPDGDAVYVAETGSYQVRRHWLRGPLAGESEVVLDRLPGFPDNLSARGDGTFWLALPDPRNPRLDTLLPRPALRRAVAALPERLRPHPSRQSLVLRFDGEGRILETLHGPGGAYSFITSAREHDGWLYLGSLDETAVARLRL